MKKESTLQWRIYPLALSIVCLALASSAFTNRSSTAPASGTTTQTYPTQLVDDAASWFGEVDLRACSISDHVASYAFIPGVFSLPVMQQPTGQNVFVSEQNNMLTQFRQPQYSGVTALLAHNYLSGGKFYQVQVGQPLWVVYSSDHIHRYRVTEIRKYQKVDPFSLTSDLIDLTTQERLTVDQVYDHYYQGDHHVTLQTCLEGAGRSDWGLTFVVAEPDQD